MGLREIIAYKFRTQSESREMGEEIFNRGIVLLAYIAGPLARPIERITNRIYEWYANFGLDN